MATLEEKLRGAAQAAFPDGLINVESLKNGKRIVTVTSVSFAGQPFSERKKKVRAALEAALTEDEARQVANVVADTPEESTSLNATLPSQAARDD